MQTLDYRTLFRRAPANLLVLAPDLTMLEATDERLAATATTRDGTVGRVLFEVFPDNPDDPEATGVRNLRASLETVLRTGAPDTMALQKYDIRRPAERGDGFEERYWSPLNVPVLGPDGEVQYIVHRVVDMTEFVQLQQQEAVDSRRAAELQARNDVMQAEIIRSARALQRANAALRERNEAMRALTAIVQSSDDAIVGYSVTGTVTSWNRGAERLYGYAAAEAVGHSMASIVPPERAAELEHACVHLLRGESIEPFESIRIRKDGSRVNVFLSFSPIRNDRDDVVGVAIIGRDITAQKRSEAIERQNRALQEENRRALRASRAKTEFVASMSHELRTPLNGIIGFTELLIDEKVGPLTAGQKDFLQDVLASAQHLLRLINNILDLSKIEAGEMELFPEWFSVADAVAEVCSILRPAAVKHGVHFRCSTRGEPFEVCLDPLRVRQVLYNLLSNAVQYNRADGSVEATVWREDDDVYLAVTDTGHGIAKDDLGKVFDEFRQLHPPNRGLGTGLGLAITRRLVDRMGGDITVTSELGRGSQFTVRLPVIAPSAGFPR